MRISALSGITGLSKISRPSEIWEQQIESISYNYLNCIQSDMDTFSVCDCLTSMGSTFLNHCSGRVFNSDASASRSIAFSPRLINFIDLKFRLKFLVLCFFSPFSTIFAPFLLSEYKKQGYFFKRVVEALCIKYKVGILIIRIFVSVTIVSWVKYNSEVRENIYVWINWFIFPTFHHE